MCSWTGCLPNGSNVNCFTETCYAVVITKSFKIKYRCFFSIALEEKAFNRGHLAGEGGVRACIIPSMLLKVKLIAHVAYFGLTEFFKHCGLQNLIWVLIECVSRDTSLVPPLCLLQWKSLVPQAFITLDGSYPPKIRVRFEQISLSSFQASSYFSFSILSDNSRCQSFYAKRCRALWVLAPLFFALPHCLQTLLLLPPESLGNSLSVSIFQT